MPSSGENWDRVSKPYQEVTTDGPSKPATDAILQAVRSTLPLAHASLIMDIGAGPGQVISAVLESPNPNDIPAPARIVAADVSQQFVTMVSLLQQRKIEAGNSLWSRVEPKL